MRLGKVKRAKAKGRPRDEILAPAQAIARTFGCSADSVTRAARELGLEAVRVDNRRVYALTAELAARLAPFALSGTDAVDPATLPPLAQRNLWMAREAQLRVRQRAGELCEMHDVVAQAGRLVTITVRAFETIPDVLERDCGLNAAAVEAVERELDRAREALYAELAADDDRRGGK